MLSCPYCQKTSILKKAHCSRSHILSKKNVHSLKNVVFSCHFFSNITWKTLASRSYLIKKNLNYVKTKVYYGPKNSIGSLFFKFLTKKSLLSCLYFVKKRQFSRKLTALMPIFCQKKRPFSQKHSAPMSFFSNFHEKSLPVMPIFGQKNVNSVKTTLYFGPKKSIGYLFF